MGHTPEALARHPNPLAAHYRRFRVGERLLLTGHSHQAWPDCGFEGQLRAWLDAAEWVDDKWARAFEQADAVRRGFARLLDDPGSDIALGASTHELLLRFLSALPLARRPRLVTTDGEFHTIRRQLDRLAEEGIEVVRVPAEPADDAAERLAAAADDRTAAALVSSVFFGSGRIVPGLGVLAERCRRVGAALLVDAYHSLNVVPFSVRAEGLADAFVVGGGYKYCQLGEGNCFLRLPPGCRLRPVVTGWFAEFAALDRAPEAGVGYGEGAARFAGSTYDPVSHYRAAAVFDFFEREGLTPALLRAVSRRQVGLLAARFDALAPDPAVIVRDRAVPLEALGGFLVLRAPAAADICRRLKAAGVWADSRGEALRLGPAPYLSDPQLEAAVAILGEVIHSA
ncbi:MAG TPA: kynureninase [Acidobacteriota bacterium]|nr:kynureninase [Acidobacteriota bacterium]